jgi:hypothetical protein
MAGSQNNNEKDPPPLQILHLRFLSPSNGVGSGQVLWPAHIPTPTPALAAHTLSLQVRVSVKPRANIQMKSVYLCLFVCFIMSCSLFGKVACSYVEQLWDLNLQHQNIHTFRLNSGGVCCCSVLPALLSKNLKIKTCKATTLHVVLYGCET